MAGLGVQFLHAAKTKKTFKAACKLYDMVYFGYVSQHADEHQMVRGFTLSPSHIDKHYCVGTVGGRDVILLERTDTISFPDKPSKSYTWLVLQLDLKSPSPVHMLLNSTRYDPLISASIVARLSHLHRFEGTALQEYDHAFSSKFSVYASLQHSDAAFRLLDPGTASVLGHHFSTFDYEVVQDTLIVYLPTRSPTLKHIESMLKAGIWLAGELDGSTSSVTEL